jgi:RsiW-degrading membrane proteinase PrsW (M82 family)
LTLIPLAFSLLQKDEGRESTLARLEQTLEKSPPAVQTKVEKLLNAKDASLDDILTALPDQRLDGAHLPRRTWMHWLYALLAVLGFSSFILLMSTREDAAPGSILAIGLFTSTVGIFFLIVVQFFASWTEGRWVIGRGVLTILFYIAKFIGFSYRSALDPDSNFMLSFFGFICGVGLCEELCKALPLLVHFRRHPSLGWRGALLWGLASGAGFGIAEGIVYSSDRYNGIATGGIYLVRFVSCVALHAMWSGSVGITLYHCRELIQGDMELRDYPLPLLRILGVAIVLHGLYDTLLTKEMRVPALIVAVASFAWLSWQIVTTVGQEEEGSAPVPMRA